MITRQLLKYSIIHYRLLIGALISISIIYQPENVFARFNDADGHLKVYWSPPISGDTVESYLWSYGIVGVADSIAGISDAVARIDSSVTLANPGDWAVFSIRAVSINHDTSTAVTSDTAYYYYGCVYVIGDINSNGVLNGVDVVYAVNFFKGADLPLVNCECTPGVIWPVAGDVNNSCSFNGLDVTYLVNYFKGGNPVQPCHDCPP
jgi:hypothetical protein